MTILFTNNAASTLASGITNVATSLTVATGQGALFPSPTGAQFFYATLENTSATIREIVKVTARTTDTFTIVRAQDGTSASAWSTGDKVQLRVTAADLNNFGQLDTANTWASGQTFVAPVLGTPASGTLTNCTGYTYANLTGTVPTWNQNTTGTAASLSAILSASLGGTGVAGTLTGVLYGNGTAAHTVATTAQLLAGVGTVPIANGGTNSTATPTAGGVGYGTGTAHAYTAAGTTGQVLTSQGAGAPIWAAASGGGGLGGQQIFTSSGTFTIPTGKTAVKVTVQGGGGGSGANLGTNLSGAGAGATAIKYLTGLTPGSTLTVTVGAGGTAGVGVNGNGGTGGTSSVSSGTQTITTISATGGAGVAYNGTATYAGGSASGGDLNISGQSGLPGTSLQFNISACGTVFFVSYYSSGGSSRLGTAAVTYGNASNTGGEITFYPTQAGAGYGWGQAGNFYNGWSGGTRSGAAGGAGVVIFEW